MTEIRANSDHLEQSAPAWALLIFRCRQIVHIRHCEKQMRSSSVHSCVLYLHAAPCSFFYFFSVSISITGSLHSDPSPFSLTLSRTFVWTPCTSFSQPLTPCVGGGVKQKVWASPPGPLQSVRVHARAQARAHTHFKSTALARPYTTFATSNSQTTPGTPTLRFQKCIWPIIVKTKACLETSQKYTGQRRGCWEKLSSDVTRFILIITDVLSWVPYSRQSSTYSQS